MDNTKAISYLLGQSEPLALCGSIILKIVEVHGGVVNSSIFLKRRLSKKELSELTRTSSEALDDRLLSEVSLADHLKG